MTTENTATPSPDTAGKTAVPPSKHADLYAEATQRIIDAIEKAQESGEPLPWRKPWATVQTGPIRSAATGYAYRGINPLMLMIANLERAEKGLPSDDPRWMTFKQVQKAGHSIKKGSKSEKLYFFGSLMVVDIDNDTGQPKKDPETGENKIKSVPFLKVSRVFNGADIEGLPPLPTVEKNDFSPIAAGEEIARRIGEMVTVEHGGSQAFYSPANDKIKMPEKDTFTSAEAYYRTLAHEGIHASGHESRLNRTEGMKAKFGEDVYAFEELIAEIGSCQIAANTGLGMPDDQSAAYVQTWLKVLKNDKKAIFKASSEAQKASDLVLGIVPKEHQDKPTQREQRDDPQAVRALLDGGLSRAAADALRTYNRRQPPAEEICKELKAGGYMLENGALSESGFKQHASLQAATGAEKAKAKGRPSFGKTRQGGGSARRNDASTKSYGM